MEHLAHLSADRKLKKIIDLQKPAVIRKQKNICLHLCLSIMSQQLSTRVARVFQQRFLALYGRKKPTPRQIANTSFEQLRNIGLSNAKASYILNVARFFIQEKISDRALFKMSNEEITECLTKIKGVGKWTTEMILMFSLGREDVFAMDDLGLQQAIIKIYNIRGTDKKEIRKKIQKISNRWIPYRTYACLYLWGWKDNLPKT